MVDRCTKPSCKTFHHYGGRGITVCDRWMQFANFLEDMGRCESDDLTIERIDNDKGYSPENCRWATMKEQARNRRNTLYIDFNGERKPLAEWCDIFGLNYKATWSRLYRKGWSVGRAFSSPANAEAA